MRPAFFDDIESMTHYTTGFQQNRRRKHVRAGFGILMRCDTAAPALGRPDGTASPSALQWKLRRGVTSLPFDTIPHGIFHIRLVKSWSFLSCQVKSVIVCDVQLYLFLWKPWA